MTFNPAFCTEPASASLKQVQTRDFDEQATLLTDWNQHYSQLTSGHFRGAIVELFFDDVHLFSEFTNQALLQKGQLDDDMIALGIPLRQRGRGMFCGQTMQENTIHLFSGDSGFEFYSPAQLTMGGIVMSRKALLSWAGNSIPEMEPGQQARLRSVSSALMRQACAFLFSLFDLCKQHPALLQSGNFRRCLRDATMGCAIDLLSNENHRVGDLSLQRRWKIVQLAQAYLQENQLESVSIEMLCRDLGVSRRTLQYSFNDLVGVNPVAFLRAHRLNGVRHMLKSTNSVTEAATSWGFWHFGHFSREYKKLFGELPSETIRRR